MILEYISSSKYKPAKIRELARGMEISANQYSDFRDAVKRMVTSGKLVRLRHGRIGLPEKVVTIQGILSVTKSRKAFVAPDDGSEEIVVTDHGLGAGIDGDTVEVRLRGRNIHGRVSGDVVKIVERKLKSIVGTYHQTRFHTCVRPDDPRLKMEIRIEPPKGTAVKEGTKVVVHLDEWLEPDVQPTGKLVQVLGFPGDPGVDVLTVIHKFNLPMAFPRGVETEADEIPAAIAENEIARRLDLRHKTVFTIDPEDAKDHDDAVSLDVTSSGYQLGIHIADVSHYVQPHSHLDKEARMRTSSAYLVDRVLPMLPERLSNNLCSLRENVDRLTLSVIVDLDKAGRVLRHKTCESIIRSKGKLSYDEVQLFLDSGKGFEERKRMGLKLVAMQDLAKELIDRRMEVGALDFELPEYKVILDDKGIVQRVVKRRRQMSNRIIEEFMLLANRLVASEMLAKNIPSLYRVHAPPDEKKLASFIAFARNFDLKASFGTPPRAKFISDFLVSLKGKDEEELLNELLVRSMQKAVYQPDNIGHFGLAFPAYLQFTSPIRRYPDLIVHRILKQAASGEYRASQGGALKASLSRIGKRCSEQEVVIMEAERESLSIKQAEFLSRQLGEIFDGVITGMLRFGFFVRVRDVGAEGLVRLSTLEDDYYVVDVDNQVIVGRSGRRRYRLGDRLRVQIVSVDVPAGEIDLRLVDEPKETRRTTPMAKSRRRR
jgi:ribonuclease R